MACPGSIAGGCGAQAQPGRQGALVPQCTVFIHVLQLSIVGITFLKTSYNFKGNIVTVVPPQLPGSFLLCYDNNWLAKTMGPVFPIRIRDPVFVQARASLHYDSKQFNSK